MSKQELIANVNYEIEQLARWKEEYISGRISGMISILYQTGIITSEEADSLTSSQLKAWGVKKHG